MNKYEKWYASIIENAKNRTLESTVYVERHHIIPRSLGGSNDPENIAILTAREHFICHWLLVKMHNGEAKSKMINAMYFMKGQSTYQKRYSTPITSRIYNKIRKEYSEYISKKNTGRIQPIEENQRQKAAQIGRKRDPFSKEWRENLSANHRSKRGYDCSLSEETKQRISEKLKGRKVDPEVVAKRSEKIRSLQLKRERISCPHCSKDIAINTYSRWHGDNCKQRKNN